MASGLLPKSPVSSSLCDEGPSHIYSKIASRAQRIFDQQCKKTFATISVKSGQTVPGQNPLLSALVQKRTRFQPSGVQGKLVLLCNRGVRPCKIMPIPSYRHPNGCSGTKGN